MVEISLDLPAWVWLLLLCLFGVRLCLDILEISLKKEELKLKHKEAPHE